LSEACDEARLLRAGIDSFSSAAWIGRRAHKGLLVLGFGDYSVKMMSKAWDQRLEWVLPINVAGPAKFTLFGIWSQNNSGEPDGIRYPSEVYRYPCGHVLEAYENQLSKGDCVLLGDFNHHPQWDKGSPQKDFGPLVDRYTDAGLVSAWHTHTGNPMGHPDEPASHWWRWSEQTPFHLDYCFLPASWISRIRNVQFGGYADFGAEGPRSDHAPIVIDLAIG